MNHATTVLQYAWADFLELLPYFFLAIFIGAAVDLLALDIVAQRSFRKHGLLGIFFTTCVGAFSPFCSFTIIPLIRRLLRGGVPLSAVMAFWIASPAMDPPIFALTAKQIGLPLATARLVGALVLSIGAGLIVLLLERRGLLGSVLRDEKDVRQELDRKPAVEALVPALAGGGTVMDRPGPGFSYPNDVRPGDPAPDAEAESPCAAACSEENSDLIQDDGLPWRVSAKASLATRRNWVLTARNIARDSIKLGKWLVFACVFEGAVRVFVPTSLVTSTLGGRGLLAIPLAVLISVPLYLNGIGAIPIVGALLAKGMVHGAAISFLLGGAVTTIPAMVAVRSVVRDRIFLIYVLIGIIGSTLIGFVAQFIV
jgi:uncharacterized protein